MFSYRIQVYCVSIVFLDESATEAIKKFCTLIICLKFSFNLKSVIVLYIFSLE